MPELPEVEACRRVLERHSVGHTLRDVEVFDAAVVRSGLSSRPSDALVDGETRLRAVVVGARSLRLERIGKRIAWMLDRDDALLLHLGMTGAWVQRPGGAPIERFARLRIGLEDGSDLWYTDARRFGCVTLCPVPEVPRALRGTMGPDAWTELPDAPTLAARLRGSRPLKVVLMDQAVVAGLGNIHVVEALWRAGIHPERRGDSLSSDEAGRLRSAVHAQLAVSIAEADAGEYTYVSQGGPNPFAVYGRDGQPCKKCGSPILVEVHAGRSTYWCGACQPAGSPWRSARGHDKVRGPLARSG